MTWTKFEKPASIYDGRQHLVVGRLLKNDVGQVCLVGNINSIGGTCDDCPDHTDWLEYSDDLVTMIAASEEPQA